MRTQYRAVADEEWMEHMDIDNDKMIMKRKFEMLSFTRFAFYIDKKVEIIFSCHYKLVTKRLILYTVWSLEKLTKDWMLCKLNMTILWIILLIKNMYRWKRIYVIIMNDIKDETRLWKWKDAELIYCNDWQQSYSIMNFGVITWSNLLNLRCKTSLFINAFKKDQIMEKYGRKDRVKMKNKLHIF